MPMAWITRGTMALSAPYRIIRSIRGHFEVWVFAADRSGCLARQLDTLAQAKAFCERDRAKQEEIRA